MVTRRARGMSANPASKKKKKKGEEEPEEVGWQERGRRERGRVLGRSLMTDRHV